MKAVFLITILSCMPAVCDLIVPFVKKQVLFMLQLPSTCKRAHSRLVCFFFKIVNFDHIQEHIVTVCMLFTSAFSCANVNNESKTSYCNILFVFMLLFCLFIIIIIIIILKNFTLAHIVKHFLKLYFNCIRLHLHHNLCKSCICHVFSVVLNLCLVAKIPIALIL